MADFLDKLKEQVTAGITTVTTKSRVAVETTRLRSQMRRIAKEKREALAQLGFYTTLVAELLVRN